MIASDVYLTEAEMEPPLHRLEGRVVWLWRVVLLGQTAALTVAVLVLEGVLDRWLPVGLLLAVVVAVGLTLAVFWPPARYRGWGYQVRDDDLVARRGVLSQTTSVIPHTRIQHVDTRRDLLERWFGLARVVVYTAGIRGAELTIPGLPMEEAEALRDRLAALGGAGDAV